MCPLTPAQTVSIELKDNIDNCNSTWSITLPDKTITNDTAALSDYLTPICGTSIDDCSGDTGCKCKICISNFTISGQGINIPTMGSQVYCVCLTSNPIGNSRYACNEYSSLTMTICSTDFRTSCVNCDCISPSVTYYVLEDCNDASNTYSVIIDNANDFNIGIGDILVLNNSICCWKVIRTLQGDITNHATIYRKYNTCQDCLKTHSVDIYTKEKNRNFYYPEQTLLSSCDTHETETRICDIYKQYKKKSLYDKLKIGSHNAVQTYKDKFMSMMRWMTYKFEINYKSDCILDCGTCCAPCIRGFNELLYFECLKIGNLGANFRCTNITNLNATFVS